MRTLVRGLLFTVLCLALYVPMASAQEEVVGPFLRANAVSLETSRLASGDGDSRLTPLDYTVGMGWPSAYANANVVDYTSDETDPTACAGYTHSRWAKFTVPYTGRMSIDTYYSEFDTVLAVYHTAPTSANLVACNDDTGEETKAFVVLNVEAGDTFYLMAGAAADETVTADNDYLDLWFIMNDYYRYAYIIPSNSTSYVRVQPNSQSSSSARDYTFPCLPDEYNFNHGVWHKFTPATTGSYDVTTTGSNYNTVLAVYSNGPILTLVGCNNNTVSGSTSRVVVNLNAGRVYFIQVARVGSTPTTTNLTTRLTVRLN